MVFESVGVVAIENADEGEPLKECSHQEQGEGRGRWRNLDTVGEYERRCGRETERGDSHSPSLLLSLQVFH